MLSPYLVGIPRLARLLPIWLTPSMALVKKPDGLKELIERFDIFESDVLHAILYKLLGFCEKTSVTAVEIKKHTTLKTIRIAFAATEKKIPVFCTGIFHRQSYL